MKDPLTEELKKAGFPRIGKAWMDKDSGVQVFHEVPGWDEIYIPISLEELINTFSSGLSLANLEGKWKASKPAAEYFIGIGETPVEAVGRLWLIINAHSQEG